MKRPPRLYFSFRSPYSWLTVQRLRAAVPDADTSLEWLPYWDPDEVTERALKARGAQFHYVQMSRAKHLYLLFDTKRLAQRLGVAMAWPIDVDCWWELPHLAFLAARREGRASAFYDEIVSARWGRGEDICAPDVVRRAAEAAGFDPALAVGAPDDEAIRAEAVDCLATAYDDDVFGIPYLKWGRHRFWGYDRLDGFLEVWAQAAPAAPVAAPTGQVAFDTDTAGGCG
ncbi:2-hydroxychromene-2-carboxylate isomerase [Luedemannella helvata]|uniref:2-hydroxychromene-2-carboxylate isomerase n=1 Tax=Luedemannella helvata TaxID=349315 RepID=A0ABN2KV35_9ACTN